MFLNSRFRSKPGAKSTEQREDGVKKNLVVLIIAITCFVRCLGATNVAGAAVTSTNSVPPDFLPIGSEQAVLDWAVTNRQWSLNGKPLNTEDSWELKFEAGGVGRSSTSLKFNSFKEFEEAIVTQGKILKTNLLKRNDASPEEDITLIVTHGYHSFADRSGASGIYIEKNLGKISEITPESFSNLEITYYQAVVRIPGLEKFEVSVDGDIPYSYAWPSRVAKPASVFQNELTDSSFVALSSWYSVGLYRARFKITVGGQTCEYTQAGAKLVPPSINVLNDSQVEVTMTPGSDTEIESSTDLVNWTTMETIPWDYTGGSKKVLVYPPSSPFRFFRAKSL